MEFINEGRYTSYFMNINFSINTNHKYNKYILIKYAMFFFLENFPHIPLILFSQRRCKSMLHMATAIPQAIKKNSDDSK